jgi:hypothetical protein
MPRLCFWRPGSGIVGGPKYREWSEGFFVLKLRAPAPMEEMPKGVVTSLRALL